MTALYRKSRLAFALVWIVAYVVLASVADAVSVSVGVPKLITVFLLSVMSILAVIWSAKNKLLREFGLCRASGRASAYLFYVPLVLLTTVNLWNGVAANMPAAETVFYVSSMLLVGFLEEVIFRGFLFRALAPDGIKSAFAISSVTFGIGHIVNLLNGAELLPTVLQIVSAVFIGFMFTSLFYKSGSLWAAIAMHGAFNSLSAFSVEPSDTVRILTCVAICLISGAYSLYILRISDR